MKTNSSIRKASSKKIINQVKQTNNSNSKPKQILCIVPFKANRIAKNKNKNKTQTSNLANKTQTGNLAKKKQVNKNEQRNSKQTTNRGKTKCKPTKQTDTSAQMVAPR